MVIVCAGQLANFFCVKSLPQICRISGGILNIMNSHAFIHRGTDLVLFLISCSSNFRQANKRSKELTGGHSTAIREVLCFCVVCFRAQVVHTNMADERNFRSTYYEKVGCRSVEERKSLEILLKDKPLNVLKLKQFCIRFTVPNIHRNVLWSFLLGEKINQGIINAS